MCASFLFFFFAKLLLPDVDVSLEFVTYGIFGGGFDTHTVVVPQEFTLPLFSFVSPFFCGLT